MKARIKPRSTAKRKAEKRQASKQPKATGSKEAATSLPAGKKRKREDSDAEKEGTGTGKGGLDLDNFFAFLECQLKMEAEKFMELPIALQDSKAKKLWDDFQQLSIRNQGKNEKWIPFHHVLCVHEKFVVEHIHHAKEKWTPKQRFLAMLLFRVTCKDDLFKEVYLPYLRSSSFWKAPEKVLRVSGPLEKDLAVYRKKGNALQTSCFLMIPDRLLKDDSANLIRNIVLRTRKLWDLGSPLWEVISKKKMTPEAKYDKICNLVSEVPGFGDTWVKMLMVCMDIAYPEAHLLQDRCEVGIGALPGLEQILVGEGLLPPRPPKRAREDGPKLESGDGKFGIYPALSAGIIQVKCRATGKQLIQVTKGMAGNLDRAHAIATEICKVANKSKGWPVKEAAEAKQAVMKDERLPVPKLGLDQLAEKREKARLEGKRGGEEEAGQKGRLAMASEGLGKLLDLVNKSESSSAQAFWDTLEKVEQHGQKHFTKLPLVAKQLCTPRSRMRASTLQVQLCEWRQFQDYLRRKSEGK